MDLDTEQFRQTRPGAEGYDRDEVDLFVAQVREALRHEPPSMAPWEVRDKRFRVGRFHRGYDEHAVDDFLDRAERLLSEAHGHGLDDPHDDVPARRARPLLILFVALLVVVGLVLALAR